MTKKKAYGDPYLRSIAISLKRMELEKHREKVYNMAVNGFSGLDSTAYKEFAKKEDKILQELANLES